MIITNSKGQRKEISEAEARLIRKQGISPDQFFELFPNEDNTNFAGMNIVDYDAFIDSDFQGIEEEPPPHLAQYPSQTFHDPYRGIKEEKVLLDSKGGPGRNVTIQGYPPGQYQYQYAGRDQVMHGEAKIFAEKLGRLERKADMQDVLLKISAENKEFGEATAKALVIGGTALTGVALALSGLPPVTTGYQGALAANIGLLGGSMAGLAGAHGLSGPSSYDQKKMEFKEAEAIKKYKNIELSPEAQKVYDEYKATGFSSTLKYHEDLEDPEDPLPSFREAKDISPPKEDWIQFQSPLK